MKRYQDPAWTGSMAVGLDFNYAMADFVGEHGLTDADLAALQPRLEALHADLAARREDGRLGFFQLPYQTDILTDIKRVTKPLLEWCWELVVLGIGGSALGARALHQALCHPQHNFMPFNRRHQKCSLWVLDNVDPDLCYGMLDGLDLRRTAVNVISKSGGTAETLAQFLFVYQVLKSRVGEDKVRQRLILTTDPEKGVLRRLALQEGFKTLPVPPEVGGRFSVLSAVGLLPAAAAGIDIEELLAGARYMDVRLKHALPADNLAYRLAALYYLFATAKACPLLVFMPYASSLASLGDWFCQLWAESLGKKTDLEGRVVHTGSTPIRALGATDQHSQLQLYAEGPFDKLITFVEVENFKHQVEIPARWVENDDLAYLGGRSLNELIRTEYAATAFSLMRAGRPNLTLKVPEVNAFTMGQLIMLLETATVAAGFLFHVNPLDQPGVEAGKKITYGLMGRPGFEDERAKFAQAPPPREEYLVK
jgi:glucose-6-phosphate isomerase